MKSRLSGESSAFARSLVHSFIRSFARACAACNLSVVEPRASRRARRSGGGGAGGVVSVGEMEGEGGSSIIGITGLPRAFSCPVGSARRRSADSVSRRQSTQSQSRSSSRALRIVPASLDRSSPRHLFRDRQ